MKRALLAALATSTALIAAPAVAQDAGDWTIGLGLGYVMPKDDNGSLANGAFQIDVGDSLRPPLTGEYFIYENLGIELLAAWPFKHSISVDGVGKIADTTHLPPTLSLVYHFANTSAWTPYVGIGVNYTNFYDTDLTTLGQVALETGKNALKLDSSWGVAGMVGIDYDVSPRGAVRGEVRYIDINTDATLNGVPIGTVHVDPWVFNVAYVFKF